MSLVCDAESLTWLGRVEEVRSVPSRKRATSVGDAIPFTSPQNVFLLIDYKSNVPDYLTARILQNLALLRKMFFGDFQQEKLLKECSLDIFHI